MEVSEQIDFWIDLADAELNCFADKEKIRTMFNNLHAMNLLRFYILPEDKGAVAYMIGDNMRGNDCVSELFMYVRKEFRGDIRLFKKLVKVMEDAGKENNCVSVKIGSNIGYNDDSVLRILQRWGYKTDVVIKEI